MGTEHPAIVDAVPPGRRHQGGQAREVLQGKEKLSLNGGSRRTGLTTLHYVFDFPVFLIRMTRCRRRRTTCRRHAGLPRGRYADATNVASGVRVSKGR